MSSDGCQPLTRSDGREMTGSANRFADVPRGSFPSDITSYGALQDADHGGRAGWAGQFSCRTCRRKRLIAEEFSQRQLELARKDAGLFAECKLCVAKAEAATGAGAAKAVSSGDPKVRADVTAKVLVAVKKQGAEEAAALASIEAAFGTLALDGQGFNAQRKLVLAAVRADLALGNITAHIKPHASVVAAKKAPAKGGGAQGTVDRLTEAMAESNAEATTVTGIKAKRGGGGRGGRGRARGRGRASGRGSGQPGQSLSQRMAAQKNGKR